MDRDEIDALFRQADPARDARIPSASSAEARWRYARLIADGGHRSSRWRNLRLAPPRRAGWSTRHTGVDPRGQRGITRPTWVTVDQAAQHPGRPWRRVAAVAASVACVLGAGVPVALAIASGRAASSAMGHHPRHATRHPHLSRGPAETQVLHALDATTAANSFDISYDLRESPGSSATSSYLPGPGPETTTVVGAGVMNVDPTAMALSAAVEGPMDITTGVRIDGTSVWEVATDDLGLVPDPTDGVGQELSGFSGLVEGALDDRAGAVAMLGMATPTGYLDLEQQAITGAGEVGTGTIDGRPVTQYQVSVSPTLLLSTPGLTDEESATIQQALGVLQSQGYNGTTVTVAIDNAGYILRSTSVTTFADGGKVTLTASLSNFGCAGTIETPGQPGTTPTTTTCNDLGAPAPTTGNSGTASAP